MASMVSAAGEEATNAKTNANKREKMSHLWVYFDVGTKDYTKTSKEVFCIFCKAKNVKVPINGRLDAMATCGNKEGVNKYPVATLTIQKRRTQRVDLPRGPRRRKGAQGLGLERDAKI